MPASSSVQTMLTLRTAARVRLLPSMEAGGYIGESTKSEIEYAQRNGKKVMYLEPVD